MPSKLTDPTKQVCRRCRQSHDPRGTCDDGDSPKARSDRDTPYIPRSLRTGTGVEPTKVPVQGRPKTHELKVSPWRGPGLGKGTPTKPGVCPECHFPVETDNTEMLERHMYLAHDTGEAPTEPVDPELHYTRTTTTGVKSVTSEKFKSTLDEPAKSAELERAVMKAIIGDSPIEYSDHGRRQRDKLMAAIEAYAAQKVAEAREDEIKYWRNELLDIDCEPDQMMGVVKNMSDSLAQLTTHNTEEG